MFLELWVKHLEVVKAVEPRDLRKFTHFTPTSLEKNVFGESLRSDFESVSRAKVANDHVFTRPFSQSGHF